MKKREKDYFKLVGNTMMKFLQRLGRSLMLPVAVLPAAAVLKGIGHWIDATAWGEGTIATAFLFNAGDAIISNIPILFAVGVALGMSKDQDGSAALSGLVGWLVITTILNIETVASFGVANMTEVNEAFGEIENAFIGILSGIVASVMYNRFSHVKLPDALSFFSGRRLVPIMTAVSMLIISIGFYFIWPVVYSGLVSFGTMISNLGFVGAGLYGFFNRLLIPTGLHHALNQVFWFDIAGINDIGNFWSGEGEKGVTGMYQAGFFPVMMFGLPAAALAMYHTAKTKRKKETASLMFAAGFAAFFTGVTEPLEFAFMFLAPALYVVHAFLTGLSLAIAALFQWTAGFTFSAGLIDYSLSFILPLANKPYMLLVQGVIFFVIYYVLFRFLIVTFNIKTPGREDDDVDDKKVVDREEDEGPKDKVDDTSNKYVQIAKGIHEGLGGKENISSLQYCATRLRIEVVHMDHVDVEKIKAAGALGVNVVGNTSIQVIVGTNVQFVADEMNEL